jgi:hypothetical protein
VLDRLVDELFRRGVEEIELHATPGGEPLYRRSGFTTDVGGVNMRLLTGGRAAT